MSLLSFEEWADYELAAGLTLGFHGCDASVGEAVLSGDEAALVPSENSYDWLGSGIYFWENNPRRAYEFALERAQGGRNSRGRIDTPFVLGAILNPQRNLNLADSVALHQVRQVYNALSRTASNEGKLLPTNGAGLRARNLDCLVFNALHRWRETVGLPAYDSVRGLFWEGDELYPGAGMREANHVQICVRNAGCVRGYFRPRQRASTI